MKTSLQIISLNTTNAYYIQLYHKLTNKLSDSINDGSYTQILREEANNLHAINLYHANATSVSYKNYYGIHSINVYI